MSADASVGGGGVGGTIDPHLRALAARLRHDWPTVLGVLGVAGYVAVVGIVSAHTTYDVWGGLVVGPVLILATLPLVNRIARREADETIARLLPWAFAVKVLAAAPRYVVSYVLYHGVADSTLYSVTGTQMAAAWRHGILVGSPHQFPGTAFIDGLTGFVYLITGPTMLGAFFVFAWISFWGVFFFYRALAIALPDADHQRYAKLLFFLPSILYWPSAVGKDAWMFASIGLSVYGAARLFTRRRGGWLLTMLGLGATALVRPHITAMVFVAIAAGFIVRPAGPRATVLAPIAKVAGVVVLVVGGFFVVHFLSHFLKIDQLDVQSVGSALEKAEKNTSEGGSAFTATPVLLSHPTTWVHATFNVLVRPLPTDANNAQTLLAALEGAFLVCLFLVSWHRLRAAVRRFREPVVVMSVVLLVVFVYAFSTFGNFGIVTRERVQALPFLLVLVSFMPAPRRTIDGRVVPVIPRRLRVRKS